ncbi:MAG: phosphoenolpyruvate--protein phosphotransferase [Armatimonadota bacterium]
MSEQTATILHGLAGAPGAGVGPAFRWETAGRAVPVADGAAALRAAFAAAEARLAAMIQSADTVAAPLLDAQRLMLGDPELLDGALALVAAGIEPGEAVLTISGSLASTLESAESAYFRERAIDVRAVGKLVAEILTGVQRFVPAGAVIVAEELSPLETAELAGAQIAALATTKGGPTCHAAIMARAWGIPAVVGAPAALLEIADGALLLVDGTAGLVIHDPSPEQVAQAGKSAAPKVTISRRIAIYANAGSLAEVERAAREGAEGIGLLRTEFLFQNRQTPPSEDEQAEQYTAILRAISGPVIIRALDIGADKPAPFLPLPAEPNPQLGLRGMRLLLHERELFATQLRALLRASTVGPLKILLPMVTVAGEVREARALLNEQARALGPPAPPLGAMIEVPMAALAAGELASFCDFFSLGTNDLLQFLLAADRQGAAVSYLHAAEHTAAWGLIEHVIASAHAANIPAGVCGEWGADNAKLARLVEFGIDSTSVAVGALRRVKGMF